MSFFRPKPRHVPRQPVLSIRFHLRARKGKHVAIATITLSNVVPADAVQTRTLTVTVTPAGSPPNPPIVVNLAPAVDTYTLTVNPGDTVLASDVDTNVVGPSLAGTATGVVPQPPPTTVPTTPTPSIAFA